MLGSIIGDVVGSVYEGKNIKVKTFPLFDQRCRFTDDTVLTIAIAYSIISKISYLDSVRMFASKYPNSGFGAGFKIWMAQEDKRPYNSFGNGSAMRVSPIGFAFDTEEEVLAEAMASSIITHDHPEGIKGAQATALAVFLARSHPKEYIKQKIESMFGYDLSRTLDEIRPEYKFEVSCQNSVPEAIICFLESESYEDAIRNAVSLGGDTDTQAAIAGGIAEAFYGVPAKLIKEVDPYLDITIKTLTSLFYDHIGKGDIFQ